MLYRRLPTTDIDRIHTLEKYLEQIEENPPHGNLTYNILYQKVKMFLPTYRISSNLYRESQEKEKVDCKNFHETFHNARLYLNHFIQVLNMAIVRKEISIECRHYYGLSSHNLKSPSLRTYQDLLQWGEKIIQGEKQRIQEGGNPIYMPSAAIVSIHFSKFKKEYQNQRNYQEKYPRDTYKIETLRKEANRLILKIWKNLEQHFGNLSKDQCQERCKQYGVIYTQYYEVI